MAAGAATRPTPKDTTSTPPAELGLENRSRHPYTATRPFSSRLFVVDHVMKRLVFLALKVVAVVVLVLAVVAGAGWTYVMAAYPRLASRAQVQRILGCSHRNCLGVGRWLRARLSRLSDPCCLASRFYRTHIFFFSPVVAHGIILSSHSLTQRSPEKPLRYDLMPSICFSFASISLMPVAFCIASPRFPD